MIRLDEYRSEAVSGRLSTFYPDSLDLLLRSLGYPPPHGLKDERGRSDDQGPDRDRLRIEESYRPGSGANENRNHNKESNFLHTCSLLICRGIRVKYWRGVSRDPHLERRPSSIRGK